MSHMKKFYLTFGPKYRSEEHPTLGMDERLPDGWITVYADDIMQARVKVYCAIGRYWSDLYEEEPSRDMYEYGELGRVE